jgi:hypothetical protein
MSRWWTRTCASRSGATRLEAILFIDEAHNQESAWREAAGFSLTDEQLRTLRDVTTVAEMRRLYSDQFGWSSGWVRWSPRSRVGKRAARLAAEDSR